MDARTLATVLAVVALASAGCLGTAGQGTATESPTAPPTTSATGDGGFEPATFEDGPREKPDRPDELTEPAVAEYVRTFEHRRVYNLLWMGEGTEMDLDCETHDVETVEGGYDVLVSCTGYASGGGEPKPNSTATTTPIHADWFTQYFVYRVTDDGIERRRATDDERDAGALRYV